MLRQSRKWPNSHLLALMKEVIRLERAASSANYCKRIWRKERGEAEKAH